MNLENYNDLPETISANEIESICDEFVADSRIEKIELSLKKLVVISDKQWHTYLLPCEKTQQTILDWLNDNWDKDNNLFLEAALLASYSFGLNKAVFSKALEQYSGDSKPEYEDDLRSSVGSNINPYWSLE